MRITTLALFGAVGLAAAAFSANAAPLAPAPEASNIVQVAGGCGRGWHRSYRGFCVRNRPYYRPYGYYRPYYRPYAYNPWYGPSPNDWVANQLNRRELGRLYGY